MCFFISKRRLAVDSWDWNEVFGELNVFSLINGGLGWNHGVKIKFLIK